MDDEDFALGLSRRALSVDQDLDFGLGAMQDGFHRPALLNLGTAPEVAGQGGEVRVAEEWIERAQTKIVRLHA